MDIQHFSIPVAQFDASQLPADAREPGTAAFAEAVVRYFATKYAASGLSVLVDVGDEIRVIAFPASFSDPMDVALALLQQGEIKEAVPILESLSRQRPRSRDVLYNLGIAHSELGDFDQAVMRLKQLVAIDPRHTNGLVGIGVAYQRLGQTDLAEQFLTRAVGVDPSNPHAQRNLGSVLASAGKLEAAIEHLRVAHKLAPNDPAATFGLARCLLDQGGDRRVEESDGLFKEVIERFPASSFSELAQTARTQIAAKTMRAAAVGGLRPDVMMYIADALDTFARIGEAKESEVALEIALLGTQGLDINNPEKKYRLKSLPGEFSALRLTALMYTAFRQLQPSLNVGIDFNKEYQAALALRVGSVD